MKHGFTYVSSYRLTPGQPSPGTTTFLRHPIACLLPAKVLCITPPGARRHSWGIWTVSTTDSAWARIHGYGNINPLSIDYACRPRLRSRLTLGGLAWPRNPWSFGGEVSHFAFATHACILTPTPSTPGSLRCFHGCRTLPYPPTHLVFPPQEKDGLTYECRGFGGVLEPRYIVGAGSLDQ